MKRAFERIGADAIALHLRPSVVDFVLDAARALREAAQAPGTPAFERIYGTSLDPDVPDEPAVRLSRQLMVDDLTTVVESSARVRHMSLEEAEAWLKVLGMTLASRAADLGVVTEADLAALGRRKRAELMLVQALQAELLYALDPELGL